MEQKQVAERLLPWYSVHRRDLPWRQDREPYHVWLSEIMLQQTRVEAVKGYYARFLAALPDIAALAACEDDRLNKLWEGLGYYSRVRNLKKAAQVIMTQHGGVFPRDYAAVRALPGIGDYTAGAICSICFGMPTPAVDGNVLRVITRLTASQESISKPQTKRAVTEALRAVYPEGRCGDFTQALMELGATVCIPNGAPNCALCPLAPCCESREEELWRTIPVKDAKKPRKIEKKTVFLLRCGKHIALQKRGKTGLLAGLWEFPNADALPDAQAVLSQLSAWGCAPRELRKTVGKTHIFTHIEWDMDGYYVDCDAMPQIFTWCTEAEISKEYSLPTAFRQFFERGVKTWD
ncbi:MAG: A/G-specific adenine glycosylase [Oscillospiraceae bacterium]|nr:A/G-specific adenine glycosylase [Oscillospiraceae bacterium]